MRQARQYPRPGVPEPAPRCPRPSAPEPLPGPCRVAVARVRRSSSSRLYLAAPFDGIAPDRRLEGRACPVVGGDSAGDAATSYDEHAEQVSRLRCSGGRSVCCNVGQSHLGDRASRRPGDAVVEAAPGRVCHPEGPHRAALRELIVDREHRTHRISGEPRSRSSAHRRPAARHARRACRARRRRAPAATTSSSTAPARLMPSPSERVP